jgi:hypothetical protein
VASDLPKRLPAAVVQRLTPAGFTAASNTQVLISSDYKNNVINQATQHATANIPQGSSHAAAVATATQQVHAILNQVFEELKLSLTIALQHGFWVIFIFSLIIFVAAILLKDVPLRGHHTNPQSGTSTMAQASEEKTAPSTL